MLVKLSYIAHEVSTDSTNHLNFVHLYPVGLLSVSTQDLDLIHDCFDAIDVDGSGSLDITDVTRSSEGKVLLEKMRLAHGISPGDR